VDVDAMLEDLRTLVEVESPSRDLEALHASARTVAAVIERHLGGKAELVGSDAGPHVRWSGGGDPRVLILGHHDTVFPLGTLARRPFRIEGGHATGPGVFDMLGGLVQAVHGLASLEDRAGVEILVTADEEVGSWSSRALIEERALACGAVLVAEGAADGGALKIGRKGCGTFRISVAGRASHAGLEPEAGANALVEGTWGAEPVPGLEAKPSDHVVRKARMSAWEGTPLDTILRAAGRDILIETGAWTNMSIEHTARTGADKGYVMVIPEDGCSTMNADWHNASINYALQNVAAVTKVDEVIHALG
jgi:acetylornithine deacetylase/succinyl-diaminopimelate desuccinylase-like protein